MTDCGMYSDQHRMLICAGAPGETGCLPQLVSAINAGNLSASQKAYANFTQSPAADVARANPDSRIAQALKAIGVRKVFGDVVAVDGIDHWDDYTTIGDWLEEAVQHRLETGKVQMLDAVVTDSK